MPPKSTQMEILERVEKKVENVEKALNAFVISQTVINEQFRACRENNQDTKWKMRIPIIVGIICSFAGVFAAKIFEKIKF